MRGHFIGHLVTFEHVLERIDLEADFVAEAHQRQNFIGTIGVSVDVTLPVKNFYQSFELQIDPRRRLATLPFAGQRIVAGPFFLILRGTGETVTDQGRDPHAGRRIAGIAVAAERRSGKSRLFDVFSERKLDRRRRGLEDQFFRSIGAPAHFHDDVLSADGVGGAVQHMNGGHAAGQLLVNVG